MSKLRVWLLRKLIGDALVIANADLHIWRTVVLPKQHLVMNSSFTGHQGTMKHQSGYLQTFVRDVLTFYGSQSGDGS